MFALRNALSCARTTSAGWVCGVGKRKAASKAAAPEVASACTPCSGSTDSRRRRRRRRGSIPESRSFPRYKIVPVARGYRYQRDCTLFVRRPPLLPISACHLNLSSPVRPRGVHTHSSLRHTLAPCAHAVVGPHTCRRRCTTSCASRFPLASCSAMATEEHCKYCFDVLSSYLTHAPAPSPSFETDSQYPLFVTWNKRAAHGKFNLRGCIGCLQPLPLSYLKDYALSSAFKDTRFPPVAAHELPHLQCKPRQSMEHGTVSLLTDFEQAAHLDDWEIGVHGVRIDFTDFRNQPRSAVYLPDVIPEQGWTKEETIISLVKKSGCTARVTPELRDRISLTRYKSTKCTVSYEKWRNANLTPAG